MDNFLNTYIGFDIIIKGLLITFNTYNLSTAVDNFVYNLFTLFYFFILISINISIYTNYGLFIIVNSFLFFMLLINFFVFI